MRHRLVAHSLFFVLGFTIVFSLAGLLIETVISGASLQIKQYLSYVGGIIIILFGLYLIGLVKIAALEKERRFLARKTRYAYLSSFLFGAAFAAGWSPCIGAILGAILTLAAVSPINSFLLLLAYSLGIGVPFILAALIADRTKSLMKHMQQHMHKIQLIFGSILLVLGVLILTNGLVRVAEFSAASDLFFSIDLALASSGLSLAVAFLAGLVSFLSPCVFPLLPAYLAYLGGLSVARK